MYLSKKNILKLARSEKAMKELSELSKLLEDADLKGEETNSEIEVLAYTLRHTLEDID